MSGRVLSDEEILVLQKSNEGVRLFSAYDILNLIATIKELQSERDMYKSQMEYWRSSSDEFTEVIHILRKQNAILLEVLRQIGILSPGDEHIAQLVHQTLAKVKDGES